jgi:hypothetical protein
MTLSTKQVKKHQRKRKKIGHVHSNQLIQSVNGLHLVELICLFYYMIKKYKNNLQSIQY